MSDANGKLGHRVFVEQPLPRFAKKAQYIGRIVPGRAEGD